MHLPPWFRWLARFWSIRRQTVPAPILLPTPFPVARTKRLWTIDVGADRALPTPATAKDVAASVLDDPWTVWLVLQQSRGLRLAGPWEADPSKPGGKGFLRLDVDGQVLASLWKDVDAGLWRGVLTKSLSGTPEPPPWSDEQRETVRVFVDAALRRGEWVLVAATKDSKA